MSNTNTPDSGYLEGLQRNLTNLTAQLPGLLDGSNERNTCQVHIAGVVAEIARIQARPRAAAPVQTPAQAAAAPSLQAS